MAHTNARSRHARMCLTAGAVTLLLLALFIVAWKVADLVMERAGRSADDASRGIFGVARLCVMSMGQLAHSPDPSTVNTIFFFSASVLCAALLLIVIFLVMNGDWRGPVHQDEDPNYSEYGGWDLFATPVALLGLSALFWIIDRPSTSTFMLHFALLVVLVILLIAVVSRCLPLSPEPPAAVQRFGRRPGFGTLGMRAGSGSATMARQQEQQDGGGIPHGTDYTDIGALLFIGVMVITFGVIVMGDISNGRWGIHEARPVFAQVRQSDSTMAFTEQPPAFLLQTAGVASAALRLTFRAFGTQVLGIAIMFAYFCISLFLVESDEGASARRVKPCFAAMPMLDALEPMRFDTGVRA